MNKLNKINVKKFDTQKDALEFQKSVAGRYYYSGFVRDKIELSMDTSKGNDLPYMVDVSNGDIYYVFNCDDGLQVLNKFQNHSCMTSYPFKRVWIKKDAIMIEEQGEIVKNSHNRVILAEQNQIIT